MNRTSFLTLTTALVGLIGLSAYGCSSGLMPERPGEPVVGTPASLTETQPKTDCAGWNTEAFFENATVHDVQACIASGADPNTGGGKLFTPLHLAVSEGDTEVAYVLISAGANPNAQMADGVTPLHAAAMLGNPEMIEVLVRAGANVNIRLDSGWTPLTSAAARRHTEAVEKLIRAGAYSAAEDRDRALLSAAGWGQAEIDRILEQTRLGEDEQ